MIYIIDKNEICLFREVVVNEDSMYKNKNDSYCITIDIGIGRESAFLMDPYIKIYNSNDFRRATGIARLSLIDGHIVRHDKAYPPTIKVNSSMKKWIISSLQKKSTNKKYSNLSVYNAIWKFIYDTGKNYNLKTYKNDKTIDEYIDILKEVL